MCSTLHRKSFTNLKTKATSITDVVYIRYLLAFKMWRKMEETTEKSLILPDKKERINKLALMLLGPRMPKLQDELLKFVPRPPMDQENETLWLIQDQFDIKQFHKQFLLFEDKMDNSTGLQCTNTAHADQNCSKSQVIYFDLIISLLIVFHPKLCVKAFVFINEHNANFNVWNTAFSETSDEVVILSGQL